jgi:hypothetical protein
MTSGLRQERVQELSESAYLMLKESHQSLRELKGLVDRLHEGFLQEQKGVDFDTLAAIKLTTDRMYDELERYLRPECDPDSAYEAAMTEKA